MNSPVPDLRDIHPPPPPEFWPPAPGWWIAALLLLTLFAFVTARLYRHYRHLQQRRRMLAELELAGGRAATKSATERVAAISTLLRRVALMRYGRNRVASLSGPDWLQFLDATGGAGQFSHGAGRVLENGPYVPHIEENEVGGLLVLARDWLKRNTKKP
jgi:hypothetical protein